MNLKINEFEDILKLEPELLKNIIEKINYKELALALKGSSPMLNAHILENINNPKKLKTTMIEIGTVRITEVENAQERILKIINS